MPTAQHIMDIWFRINVAMSGAVITFGLMIVWSVVTGEKRIVRVKE